MQPPRPRRWRCRGRRTGWSCRPIMAAPLRLAGRIGSIAGCGPAPGSGSSMPPARGPAGRDRGGQSRTLSISGSDSLKLSTRCGCRPKAPQMRWSSPRCPSSGGPVSCECVGRRLQRASPLGDLVVIVGRIPSRYSSTVKAGRPDGSRRSPAQARYSRRRRPPDVRAPPGGKARRSTTGCAPRRCRTLLVTWN